MKIKKLWSIIWKIFAGIVVVFSFIEFVLKWGILKAIKDFFVLIWSLRIPDILLLILILGILVWIIFLNKKVRGFSDKNITEILNDNKQVIDINEKLIVTANNIISENKKLKKENRLLKSKMEEAIKEPKKEPFSLDKLKLLPKFPEYTFILTILGDQHDNSMKQQELWQEYKKLFDKKQRIDFNTSINYLEKERYIVPFDHGMTRETCWEVTPRGLFLIEKRREG